MYVSSAAISGLTTTYELERGCIHNTINVMANGGRTACMRERGAGACQTIQQAEKVGTMIFYVCVVSCLQFARKSHS